MEPESSTPTMTPGHELARPYVGPKDYDLLQRIHGAGPAGLIQFGSRQLRFASRVCLENEVDWPAGFYQIDVDELTLETN